MAHETAAVRRERWEQATVGGLTALGILFLIAYSIVVLAPDVDPQVHVVLVWVLITTWVVFVLDLLVRLILTPRGRRWHFFWHHPIEVLSAVLPLFRAFRVLLLIRHVPFLQRRSGASVRANIIVYALIYAGFFVYLLSLATLHVERGAPGATINSFGDAIWWACVTIATVGYGDMVPVTVPGRMYAVLLMAGGLVIVGAASATVLSYIEERIGGAVHHRPRLHFPKEEAPAEAPAEAPPAGPAAGPEQPGS